ncbi:MAG: DUF302 domain-containing protein [Thermoflexaceae bacterium]|nr:DUF302 domain-containing protein [Thermoflexaceae bacterium]
MGEGFGILTEVDVTQTLRTKLGVETKPYRILGACNPGIAHRAMSADPRVGAFLPCGLALFEEPAGVTTIVLQDPGVIAVGFTADGLAEAASEAREKLTKPWTPSPPPPEVLERPSHLHRAGRPFYTPRG